MYIYILHKQNKTIKSFLSSVPDIRPHSGCIIPGRGDRGVGAYDHSRGECRGLAQCSAEGVPEIFTPGDPTGCPGHPRLRLSAH